jgi:hypothetical protein
MSFAAALPSIISLVSQPSLTPQGSTSGVQTTAQYRALIDRVMAEFSSEFQKHNAEIEIVFHENSSGTGAFTWRKDGGRTWEFHFYDGVLRIQNITADVLSLIVCHELGHHLGGYPFKDNSTWSAAEGQADYFSTHACAPRLWKNDTHLNASFAARISTKYREKCDSAFSSASQIRRDLCYRAIFAMDAMRYYEGHNLKSLPSLDRPDSNRVNQTNTNHPSAQCRIDTQLAGAFCSRPFDFNTVPGHLGQGENTSEAERDSARSHCEDNSFQYYMKRPRCWFSSLMSNDN